jgi:hypothetical protein
MSDPPAVPDERLVLNHTHHEQNGRRHDIWMASRAGRKNRASERSGGKSG